MALRLVEIFIPAVNASAVRQALDEQELPTLTEEVLDDGRARIRVLVRADGSGDLVDRLQLAFGSSDQFALLILPVEAALPRREDTKPDPATPEKPKVGSRGISREELHADVEHLARLSGVFVATVTLSTVVAAVGMLRDNVAVVIGAMVIAPLLGPNVALALGTTLGDLSLIRRSLTSNSIGTAIALGFSIILGAMLNVDPTVSAIESRTIVHLSDVVLALASGAACTLALTSGLSTTLVGVMVAVALLPPTVAVGLMLGGGHWDKAGGAALLLLANIICVNLAAVVTFLIQGVRPLFWWDAVKAGRASRVAIAIWIVLLFVLVVVMIIAEKRMNPPTPGDSPRMDVQQSG